MAAGLLAACGGGAPPASPTVSPGAPSAVSAAATPEPASASPLASVVTPISSPAPASAAASGSPPSATEVPAGSPHARPSFDPKELAALLSARITVLDVADSDLAVVVAYVDPKSGTSSPVGTFPVGSLEQLTEPVPAGRYALEFRLPAAATSGPRCTIDIADGGRVQFVAAGPDAIAVTTAATNPTSKSALLVPSSALCKA